MKLTKLYANMYISSISLCCIPPPHSRCVLPAVSCRSPVLWRESWSRGREHGATAAVKTYRDTQQTDLPPLSGAACWNTLLGKVEDIEEMGVVCLTNLAYSPEHHRQARHWWWVTGAEANQLQTFLLYPAELQR